MQLVRAILLPLLAAATLVSQSSAPTEDAARKIDAVFEKWNNSTGPGAAVSVVQHGKLIFEKGYGLANLEYDIPIRPNTVFHVASVSKQFTAMAIVLLERDGKLSLEDSIHKYLTELPDYGKTITIRHLLQHTSGIRDQWQTLALAGWSLEDVITQEQILQLLFRQKELNFNPGSEHLYSNGGYTLAAEIVARVSGKPFPEFCRERIFKPLGMTNTHFHLDHHRIVRDRAYSYSGGPGHYEAAPLNYANVGATSLFTTATDLTKWLDNFRHGKVGGQAAVARLQEQAIIDGKPIDYALGVSVGKHRGLKNVSHSGGDAGYRSFVAWFPEDELGVAVVSNLASFNPAGEAYKVAAVYLGSRMGPDASPAAPVSRSFISVDTETLKRYQGTYPLPRIDQELVAVARDGKLFAAGQMDPPVEMKAMAPNRFWLERLRADIEFTAGENGAMKVKITQPGGSVEGERSTTATEFQADLGPYTGKYWSDELEAQYVVSLKDGKLVATHVHQGIATLRPSGRDTFQSNQWFMQRVRFVRDAQGNVNGMRLGGGRLRGVLFAKK